MYIYKTISFILRTVFALILSTIAPFLFAFYYGPTLHNHSTVFVTF